MILDLCFAEPVVNFGHAVIEVPDTTLQLTIQQIPRPLGEERFRTFWKGVLTGISHKFD